MRRGDQRGASTIVSILVVVLGSGLVMFVAALFATGLMQKRIWPQIQARVNQAVTSVNRESAPVDTTTAAPAPEQPVIATDEDLLAQIETQKAFLEAQERELQALRAEIDDLVSELGTLHTDEVTRQAKMFAAMKPDQAAAVLASVDDPTLVAILKAMNARAASQVAAKIHPRRLAKLSMEGIAASEIAALVPSGAGR